MLDRIAEVLFGLLGCVSIVLAARATMHGDWLIAAWLILFAVTLAAVSVYSRNAWLWKEDRDGQEDQ